MAQHRRAIEPIYTYVVRVDIDARQATGGVNSAVAQNGILAKVRSPRELSASHFHDLVPCYFNAPGHPNEYKRKEGGRYASARDINRTARKQTRAQVQGLYKNGMSLEPLLLKLFLFRHGEGRGRGRGERKETEHVASSLPVKQRSRLPKAVVRMQPSTLMQTPTRVRETEERSGDVRVGHTHVKQKAETPPHLLGEKKRYGDGRSYERGATEKLHAAVATRRTHRDPRREHCLTSRTLRHREGTRKTEEKGETHGAKQRGSCAYRGLSLSAYIARKQAHTKLLAQRCICVHGNVRARITENNSGNGQGKKNVRQAHKQKRGGREGGEGGYKI